MSENYVAVPDDSDLSAIDSHGNGDATATATPTLQRSLLAQLTQQNQENRLQQQHAVSCSGTGTHGHTCMGFSFKRRSAAIAIVSAVFSVLAIVCIVLVIHRRNDDSTSGGFVVPVPAPKSSSTIAFISPASPPAYEFGDNATVFRDHVSAQMPVTLNQPFEYGAHAFDMFGYLAGHDKDRASDVMDAFIGKSQWIISNRGGYGCDRILGLLDYQTLAKHATALMGYSDLTALLNAVHFKANMITFHGPMALDSWNNISLSYMQGIVLDSKQMVLQNADNFPATSMIRPGRARGRLVGGNLSVFVTLIGSPYLPRDGSGYILFLEEVGEAPYRIDRMLMQLKLSGFMDHIAGFVFGTCTACTASNPSESLTLEQVLDEHIGSLNIPSFSGGMFGHHLEQQYVLPIGVLAEIDADKGTITMLEPATEQYQ
jgi:muramoyltetrapeptide carboxypeptidase